MSMSYFETTGVYKYQTYIYICKSIFKCIDELYFDIDLVSIESLFALELQRT